jgi:hypothetical protein
VSFDDDFLKGTGGAKAPTENKLREEEVQLHKRQKGEEEENGEKNRKRTKSNGC